MSLENVSDKQNVYATVSDHGGQLLELASAAVETPDPRVHNFGLRIIADKGIINIILYFFVNF